MYLGYWKTFMIKFGKLDVYYRCLAGSLTQLCLWEVFNTFRTAGLFLHLFPSFLPFSIILPMYRSSFLVIDNFLTEEECDHIIEKAKHFGLASSGLHVDESVAKYKKYTYGKNLLIDLLETSRSILQFI